MQFRRQPIGILALALSISGCGGVSSDNIVYLTVRYDLTQALCGEHRALTPIAGDGTIANTRSADGQFVIPSGKSFILTDIHMGYSNPTATPQEQSFSVYLSGAAPEIAIWSGSAVAAASSSAYYDRALHTGIRIAAPSQICVAWRDQQHPPEIVLTGYLQ